MFEGLSNFLQGYGWVNNAQLDNEKKKKRDAYNNAVSNASKQQAALPADRSNLTPSQRGAAAIADANTASLPIITPNVQSAWDTNPVLNTLKKTGGFVADLGSRIAETGDRAKTGIDLAVNNLDFTKSQADKDANERFQLQRLEGYQGFRNNLDEQGYNNSKEIDEVARRISTGQGSIEDVGKAAAYSLNAGLTLAAPASAAVTAGKTIATPTFATVGKGVLGETALYGTGATAAQALDGQELTPEQIALNYGLAGGGAALFGFGGLGIGRLKNDRAATIAKTVDDLDTIGAQKTSVLAFKQKLVETADDIERSAIDTPTSELGKLDDGISSEITAQSKRQAAQETANRLRQEALQIPDEVQPPRQITTQNLSTPEANLVLQKATPEQLLARADAGDVEAAAAIQKQFDDAAQAIEADTVAPTPDAPVSEVIEPVQPLDSPITAQSREIAEATPPVVTRQADELTSYEGAPDRAAVEEYKRRIANGDALEPVVVMRDSQGNLGIEDGKHRFQAYQEMGIKDIPTVERTPNPLSPIEAEGRQLLESARRNTADTPPSGSLGSIARNDVDTIKSQADADVLGTKIYQAFDTEARALGTNAETILRKYWDGGESTKLMTPAEKELYGRLTKEYDYARAYGLSNGGDIDMSAARAEYSPAQTKGTPQADWGSGKRPVNERRRDEKWTSKEADVSDAPTRNYLTAYSEPFNRLRAIVDKDGKSAFGDTDFGVEATKSISSKQKVVADKFDDVDNLNRQFEAADGDLPKQERLLDDMKVKAKEAQDAYLDAMKEQIRIGKRFAKTPEQKMAVEALARQERGYRQGFIQLNMLFNPGTISANLLARPVISGVNRAARRLGGNLITNKVLSKYGFASSTPQTVVGRRVANQFMKDNGGLITETKRNWKASGADLTSTGEKVAGLPGRVGGAVMELGDPKGLTYRNTVNQMVAELEHNGIKPENLGSELQRSIGGKRWKELYEQNEYYNNILVGMTGDLAKTKGKSIANVAVAADKYIRENVFTLPGVEKLPPAVKENVLQLFTKGIAGYIVPTLRIAQEGLSSGTLGIPRIISAVSRIKKATTQAEAAAAATQLQNGIRDAAVGAGIYGIGWTLVNNWTGSYPEDPNERARGTKDGIQADRLAIPLANGETYYLDPSRIAGGWGNSLVSYLSFLKAIHDGGNLVDAGLSSLHSLSQTGGTDSLLSNFTSVADIANGNVDGRLVGNVLSNAVPFSSAQRFVNNVNEPNQKDTSGVGGPIAQSIVGLGQTLPDKLDTQGNPIKNPSGTGLSWLKVGQNSASDTADPLTSEIDRLAKAGFEVFPTKQNTNAADNGKANAIASQLLDDPFYKSLDDEDKGAMMKELLAGTKTKDFNEGLDSVSAIALAKYSLLGTQKGDAWKSNSIDNFADYSLAKYQNEVLNGEIDKSSTENDDQTVGSLRYNAIAGQVLKQTGANNDTWNSYQSTSKTKFNALDPSNPVRKALQAMDEQLVAAGLPSKFQNSKGGYGSGSGSGGGKNFSFASAKAANAIASGFKDPVIKSAWNTPLVKPNAIGEASAKAKRKISVKRGVSL